jgi:dihydrolipoamide dehydrogenase
MTDQNFDLIVVGSGPGGYVAAIRARQLGMKTAVVEREQLGGICLNWGCIPTKALLRAAEIRHLLRHLDEFGLNAGEVQCDFSKVIARSRKVAKRLAMGVKHLMKKNGIEVVHGHARIAGPGRLRVATDGGEMELRAPHIVLATGARARSLPGLAPDGERIWTYREAMVPEALPESLLVVGAGAIGTEFASFYRDMGAEVTVVEILPQILPVEDAEIAGIARQAFEKSGMRIHTEAAVASVENRGDGVVASLRLAGDEMREIDVDRVILAVGVEGNLEDIGLETTAVQVDGGHIVTNEWMETAEPGFYAVGDVAGPPWLAHKASHEGVLCVEKIAGIPAVQPLDTTRIPGCTYCRPQVASVGLTEQGALEAGHQLRVGRFPFRANGRAVALGDTEGLVKTVFDATTGELLGAHLVGADVTEMIQGFAIARSLETTGDELMQTVFPHPTLSESMHESILDAFGRAINF